MDLWIPSFPSIDTALVPQAFYLQLLWQSTMFSTNWLQVFSSNNKVNKKLSAVTFQERTFYIFFLSYHMTWCIISTGLGSHKVCLCDSNTTCAWLCLTPFVPHTWINNAGLHYSVHDWHQLSAEETWPGAWDEYIVYFPHSVMWPGCAIYMQ